MGTQSDGKDAAKYPVGQDACHEGEQCGGTRFAGRSARHFRAFDRLDCGASTFEDHDCRTRRHHFIVADRPSRIQSPRAAFLAQWALGNASGAFAIPAGVGDVVVGLLAPLAAIQVSRSGKSRWIGYGWNALDTLDLVSAVTLGILNGVGILPPPANDLAPCLY
jgi:hypothetical protein